MVTKSLEKFTDEIQFNTFLEFRKHVDSDNQTMEEFEKEERNKLNNKVYNEDIKVIFDDSFKTWRTTARRPYFRVRGPKITKEQAFDIIRKTDTQFTCMSDKQGNYLDNKLNLVNTTNLENRWFTTDICPSFNGWCNPDGTIGYNDITSKYPELVEFLEDVYMLLKEFPYLNFVWAVTDWNEMPQYMWDKLFGSADSPQEWINEEYPDFNDNISILFWVHDNTLEIMEGQKAKEKYIEYNSLYGQDDGKFTQNYYDLQGKSPVDVKYLDKCLASHGLTQQDVEFLYTPITK